jgi:hypothetical protein
MICSSLYRLFFISTLSAAPSAARVSLIYAGPNLGVKVILALLVIREYPLDPLFHGLDALV